MEFIDITAKTVEEAIASGLSQLEKESKEIVETKVMEEPSGGFLGIGKKPAVVRLFFKDTKVSDGIPSAVDKSVNCADEISLQEVTAAVDNTSAEVAVSEEVKIISADVQGEIADNGKQFLLAMFEKMGLTVVIEKRITDERILFQVHGDDLGILIGKHGQTLDAIQYLTNLVANKGYQQRCHIMVDVEDYRTRREQTLIQLAMRLADKAKRNHQKVALEPMNAYERKVIHLALQDEPYITTTSDGEGTYRHVVIEYVK